MGSSSGGSQVQYLPVYTNPTAEMFVTPAVSRSPSQAAAAAIENQSEQKARLRGIRSTYSRFTSDNMNGRQGVNGSSPRLG